MGGFHARRSTTSPANASGFRISEAQTISTDKRIRGRALQARRERKRREQPLCIRCLKRGITRVWTQLDHTIALINGGEDTDENTQGLCDDCHEEKTREDLGQHGKQTIGTDGWPA